MLSPTERTLRAKLAAHSLHASRDSRELTANARSRFLQRFDDEVDPDRVLPSKERQRRAGHARAAFFTRLALASSKTRRRRRADRETSVEAPSEVIGGAPKEVRDVKPIAAS